MIGRLFTPRKGMHGPIAQAVVERIGDSGGGWYRPAFKTQNPASDPKEPYGGESSSVGTDHGWANCTMSAGAMVLDFDTLGSKSVWGGDLRHHQGDLSGGTDLYDLRDAWAAYGQTLTIRSGAGWDDVQADRAAGRALVLQGEGGTPGAGTYTGGHAIAVLPETASDGDWLIGNPECNGFEWVSPSALRDWADNWSSSIAWARSDAHMPGGDEMKAGDDFNFGWERWTLDGSSTTYCLGGPRLASGETDSALRLCAAGPSSPILTVVDRSRLTNGTLVADSAELWAAITGGALPGGSGDADADIAEAVEARDAEWVAHLTPD